MLGDSSETNTTEESNSDADISLENLIEHDVNHELMKRLSKKTCKGRHKTAEF